VSFLATDVIWSAESKNWPLRREFWLSQKYFTDSQLNPTSIAAFAGEWSEIKKNASCVIVGDEFSHEVLSQFSSLPSEIELLQSCDSVLKFKDKWWPRNFWSVALRESLVTKAQKLDTHRAAYLTGEGGHALASLVILAQLGFKRIVWVVSELDRNESYRKIFLRHFFGVSVEFILGEELILQPNNGSILINTLSHFSGVEFLQDLIYLNFLQKGGLVVETQLDSIESQLLTEAESVGVHSVAPWHLEGLRDHMLLLELSGSADALPNLENYLKEWLNYLKTRPTLDLS
jgi:shikimate 5-dehydrogenase